MRHQSGEAPTEAHSSALTAQCAGSADRGRGSCRAAKRRPLHKSRPHDGPSAPLASPSAAAARVAQPTSRHVSVITADVAQPLLRPLDVNTVADGGRVAAVWIMKPAY